MSSQIVDLTDVPAAPVHIHAPVMPNQTHPTSSGGNNKRPNETTVRSQSVVKKVKNTPKKCKPHVLLWICHHGRGQKKTWSGNSLKVIGVYSSKEKAEMKKAEIMRSHECCGHGDILVGDSWDDEIDLVIKPTDVFLDDN